MKLSIAVVAVLVGVASGLISPVATVQAQGVTVTKKDAPNRDGANPGDNNSCPPGPDASSKSTPDAKLGDKDVDGDGTLDFFMGEWEFVLGVDDVKVRLWCINRKKKRGHTAFSDFFSTEVLTSKNGVDTQTVPPGTPD